MDKKEAYTLLLAHLRGELESAVHASRDAADYATNEEARAESKYDTQGLEASYLAAGQAAHAREFAEAIQSLIAQESALTVGCDRAVIGALLECALGKFREWFYLAPSGGGEVLKPGAGGEITVITPESPLGRSLLGKVTGDSFALANGNRGEILTIH